MASGEERRVDQLRMGDVVAGNHTVRCLIEYVMAAPVRMVYLGRAGWTEGHPIQVDDEWVFPKEVATAKAVPLASVFNVVLESGHVLVLDGVTTTALTHPFTGRVFTETGPYYGPRLAGHRNVRDDLAQAVGWAQGRIVYTRTEKVRGPDGKVVAVKYQQ